MIVSCRGVTGELDKLSREMKATNVTALSFQYGWRYTIDLHDWKNKITYHMENVREEEIEIIQNHSEE